MTVPKKSDKVSPAAGTPSALPLPAEPLDLTDAELDSVIGGAAALDSLAVDNYESPNLAQR
jgi:hypothetical protein